MSVLMREGVASVVTKWRVYAPHHKYRHLTDLPPRGHHNARKAWTRAIVAMPLLTRSHYGAHLPGTVRAQLYNIDYV